jgi:alpha-ketoglutarate-dependent taurine dioxygenase
MLTDIHAGFIPQRTADPAEAFALVRAHGAAILTGAGASSDDARNVAYRVVGSLDPVVPDPAPIKERSDNRDRRYYDLMPGASESTTAVPFQSGHTDGFAYGDRLPDFIFLLCLRAASAGGESLAVDTYRILEEIANSSDADDRELYEFLTTEPVEQTEPGFQNALAPVVVPTPSGRRLVRWTLVQRADPALTGAALERQERLLGRWRTIAYRASLLAPKFALQPGEAMCLDNYRMLHGRTGFDDLERTLYRIWAWTREAYLGAPEGMLFSDSRYAVAK